jgi:competence protein ComEC
MVASRIFLYLCLSFILGIFINSLFSFSQVMMLGFLIVSIFLISVFWQYKPVVIIGFCLLFLVIGLYNHQQAILKIDSPREGEVSFIGRVVSEPDLRQDHLKLVVESDSLNGKVLLSLARYPEYNYGDRISVSGYLQSPEEDIEGFNYKNYLSKDGIYSVIRWPEVKLLPEKKNSLLNQGLTGIFFLKNKLRESIDHSLPSPQNSVMAAMILGDKRRLPEKTKEELNFAGLRHVTAISGMHIVIVGSILSWAAVNLLKLKRNQVFYLVAGLLFVFIVMVGLPSSAIRAGIMFAVLLYAAKEGRTSSSDRALIFTAVIMLMWNPLLLAWDVGFQLSFLACLGIVYLGPIFRYFFSGQSNFFLMADTRNLLAITLAAQISTLPILIYNFGYISQVAPLANILVVPLLPLIMVFGLISGIIGIVWPFLGLILSWPAWLLLSFLTGLSSWLANLPFSVRYFNFSWIWLIILYLFLAVFVFYLRYKIENRNLLR